MSSILAVIQEKAQLLSPQRQAELVDFADFLLSKEQMQKPQHKLAFDWVIESEEGAKPLDSEELQHQTTQSETAKPTHRPRFDWCDGPDDPPSKMTSVEMQHEVLEWMVQKAEEHLTKR